MAAMFDLDLFLEECRCARHEGEPRLAVRDVVQRAMATPGEIAERMSPSQAGITLLHHDDELTVLDVVWAPHMSIYPHDHRMWAVIGIYAGQEDNVFYRRSAPGAKTLTESGGKRLAAGEVVLLGDATIHGVTNPKDRLTGAIHVYGGDFLNQPRSQWGPGPREERPYDLEETRRQFAEANAAWLAAGS
jgi:predicted metal-dependent enzyme (double-stranded beta helix superfamily)